MVSLPPSPFPAKGRVSILSQIPLLSVLHSAELPVLYSRSLLVVCFKYSTVYMSVPNSLMPIFECKLQLGRKFYIFGLFLYSQCLEYWGTQYKRAIYYHKPLRQYLFISFGKPLPKLLKLHDCHELSVFNSSICSQINSCTLAKGNMYNNVHFSIMVIAKSWKQCKHPSIKLIISPF